MNKLLTLLPISVVLFACGATSPEQTTTTTSNKPAQAASYKGDGIYTEMDPTMLPDSQVSSNEFDYSEWKLVWNDEFDYPNSQLEEKWISQNGPTGHPLVASSRWRENAVVKDGILELQARKESRGGQDWTTGNVWSKRDFGYGYFEARYKYAAAPATNNSFWLWPAHGSPVGEKRCEVDINEGHYPNVVNSNVHNWTDKWAVASGGRKHNNNQIAHTFVGEPDHTIQLASPIKTNKVRLTTKNPKSLHLREFRVFAPSVTEIPDAYEPLTDNSMNLVADKALKIKTNGSSGREASKEDSIRDNNMDSRWVSRYTGKKWIELEWPTEQEIGSVQFVNGLIESDAINNGWLGEGLVNRNLMTDYTLEYFDGENWVVFHEYDSSKLANFGEEFQTYGVAWDEDYFRFYFNGKLFYTVRN